MAKVAEWPSSGTRDVATPFALSEPVLRSRWSLSSSGTLTRRWLSAFTRASDRPRPSDLVGSSRQQLRTQPEKRYDATMPWFIRWLKARQTGEPQSSNPMSDSNLNHSRGGTRHLASTPSLQYSAGRNSTHNSSPPRRFWTPASRAFRSAGKSVITWSITLAEATIRQTSPLSMPSCARLIRSFGWRSRRSHPRGSRGTAPPKWSGASFVTTSFNVRDEPIVCTPADAGRCFMGTAIDTLVIGDCLPLRSGQPAHRAEEYAAWFHRTDMIR